MFLVRRQRKRRVRAAAPDDIVLHKRIDHTAALYRDAVAQQLELERHARIRLNKAAPEVFLIRLDRLRLVAAVNIKRISLRGGFIRPPVNTPPAAAVGGAGAA